MRCVKSRRFWAVRCVSRDPAGLRSPLSRCGRLTPRSPAQYLSLSLKYTRLTDDQLRFFPRYLVNLDLSHSSACSAHRLSKLLARCSQLQFLALNNCAAASAMFSSEHMLGAACAGFRVTLTGVCIRVYALTLCAGRCWHTWSLQATWSWTAT
jgi:hypothetical protein